MNEVSADRMSTPVTADVLARSMNYRQEHEASGATSIQLKCPTRCAYFYMPCSRRRVQPACAAACIRPRLHMTTVITPPSLVVRMDGIGVFAAAPRAARPTTNSVAKNCTAPAARRAMAKCAMKR